MAEKTQKMEYFSWSGTDRKGQKASGELSAGNLTLAKAELRRQGINAKKIVKKKPKRNVGGKIVPKDIAVFSRQMATMMSSGVPLVQSFEIIGRGHDNPAMRDLVGAIRADVEGGSNLADSLAKHPKYFDPLTCNLVHAGEQAGILESMLDRIATYKEKTEAIKSKVKKAMFYPTAVMVVAFIITAILLIYVIPQFQALFESFGGNLPALTLMVIGMSEVFQEYWYAIFGTIGGLVYAFINAKKNSQAFRDFLDRLSLKIPVIGPILEKAALARFARTLSTMFAAGVPLVEAMDSVAGAVGNVIFREAVLKMRDDVATGTSMTASMNMTGVFPNMMVQMASIGEEAGSIDTMLSKVADFYEEEVDNMVDALSSLMEPLIMAVLGVLIGGMVVAMYLPIFKMGSVV